MKSAETDVAGADRADVVLADRPAPHIVRLRINRPDKRNAIDQDVRESLLEKLDPALADADVRALVFGGVGGVFSAGGDLPSMRGLSRDAARARMEHVHVLCRRIAGARVPVVSAVEGFGAGAAVGLALLGDHIVVGPGTKILFPFLGLGLAPDWGQTWTLPRRVGLPTACRLFTSGRPVGGDEALRTGLADELVPDADVMSRAVAKAAELAHLPQGAFALLKARLQQSSASLDEELAREAADQIECLTSDDFAEGFDAFANKRRADFIGRRGRTASER